MKKIGIAALSFCLILTTSADPLMQWVSDNATGGPGSVVDSNGSPLPPTTDWMVELVDTSDQSVLYSTTAGFQTAAGRFIETPDATAWNGLHVKTVIYNANTTNAATMKAEFSNTVLLSWGTDPAPNAVERNNAGAIDAMDWQPTVINEAPVAFNCTDTVDENGSVDITLVATDADNDPLIYSMVDQPLNGAVSINGNTAAYTPDSGYYGSDSFTFKANDGTDDSNVATINITVNPVAPSGAPVSDTAVFRTVSGIPADAYDNNNQYQAVTEAISGDTSALEHRWTFNVIADELVTFYVEAHHSVNSEGDDIVFAYSTNAVDWIDMVIVSKTTDDNTLQFFPLPTQTGGTIYVRALDTDRTSGNTALDTVYVDTIFIYSEASTAAPTSAHSPIPANGAVDMAVNVDLNWIAGLMTASHDVYFGTSPSPGFQGNQAGTVFDPGTLLNDTTYYWAVDEVNNSGTTTGSVWSFTTVALPNTPPAAPGGLTATALSPSGIDLSWTDYADNETGFVIERSARNNDNYSQIATVGANVTSFSDTGLKKNTIYFYRVLATNPDGDSTWSNEADAKTLR
jgi:hypothetical protein